MTRVLDLSLLLCGTCGCERPHKLKPLGPLAGMGGQEGRSRFGVHCNDAATKSCSHSDVYKSLSGGTLRGASAKVGRDREGSLLLRAQRVSCSGPSAQGVFGTLFLKDLFHGPELGGHWKWTGAKLSPLEQQVPQVKTAALPVC